MSHKVAVSNKKQVFTTCTLKDLCPEDKQKVAQLVKQVVELGKENQQLKATAATAAAAEEKLRQIQECNKQAVKDNCSLKNKLGQAVSVLRMYHHKVQGLDAALRALQHPAAADSNAQQQQQQQEHALVPSLPPTAAGDEPPAEQQQQQQVPPAAAATSGQAGGQQSQPLAQSCSSSTQGQQQTSAPQGATGEQSAAASPQTQATAVAGASSSSHPGCANTVTAEQSTAASPQNVVTSTTAAEVGSVNAAGLAGGQQPCDCSSKAAKAQLCSVPQQQQPLPLAMADMRLGPPLQQLQAWQLQDSRLFGEQQVVGPRAVLQFDASIGSRGAFVIQDMPAQQLQLLGFSPTGALPQAALEPLAAARVSGGGRAAAELNAAAAAAVAAAGQPLSHGQSVQQEQLDCSSRLTGRSLHHQQQQQQQQQPVLLSASGAATAAAAAAASSALAAVKAAAAACAAPAWENENGHDWTAQQLQQAGHSFAEQRPVHQLTATSTAASSQEGFSSPEAAGHFPGQLVSAQAGHTRQVAAVEEVAVMDLSSAPVHVLVQNEKSSSSLHQAHACVTVAAADAQQAAVNPDVWVGSAGHRVAGQQPQQCQQQQQLTDFGASHAMQADVAWWQSHTTQQQQQQEQETLELARAQLQQYNKQQRQVMEVLGQQDSHVSSCASTVSSQQHQHQHQHPLLMQGRGYVHSAATGDDGRTAAWAAEVRPIRHKVRHGAGTKQQQQQQPCNVLAASCSFQGALVEPPSQLHRPPAAAAAAAAYDGVTQQQQHQQGASSWPCVSACGARELLQKFDESLVDILAEVERLEQQQQKAHKQLQQQQQQQQPTHAQPAQDPQPWLQQQQHQQYLVHDSMGRVQQGRHQLSQASSSYLPANPAGPVSSVSHLGDRQARLQARIMQLQQEDDYVQPFGGSTPAGLKAHKQRIREQQVPAASAGAAAWGYGSRPGELDADAVSDILNHLD